MEGDPLVVLSESKVRLKQAGDDLGDDEVLGVYAGHAGPYGLVLAFGEGMHPAAALTAEAVGQRSGMRHVHAEA